MNMGQQEQLSCQNFMHLRELTLQGPLQGKESYSVGKYFNQAHEDIIQAFTDLGSSEEISEDICIAIEKFVCRLYHPKSKINEIGELRWLLFRQKQREAEKLPPTGASLIQTIQRAYFQALIWFQHNHAHQVLPPVTNYGWENDDHGGIRPIMY